MSSATVVLAHHKVGVALHQLRGPSPAGPLQPHGHGPEGAVPAGRPLLVLHGLGERTLVDADLPAELAGWPGPVWGLDFTGHGASTVPPGGGYTCELLMADVDVALGHLGEATLWGRGLGAYVALLAAGARPTVVRGAVLADGPGLAGGGPRPVGVEIATAPPGETGPPDPFALVELSRDVRAPGYASAFARAAVAGAGGSVALVVAVEPQAWPEWLRAVAAEPGVAALAAERALGPFLAGG